LCRSRPPPGRTGIGPRRTDKRELGTGRFVVCGQNSRRGGIFDYWGVPLDLRTDAVRLLTVLRTRPVEEVEE
jgi:hypothetical protein